MSIHKMPIHKMPIHKRIKLGVVMCLGVLLPSDVSADTFFFTGPNDGDFFVEANWNSLADGSGFSPVAGTIEPTIGVLHDLIIDGDSVTADGSVDIGDGNSLGSLDIRAGSSLDIANSAFNAQFDISTGASFTFVDASLTADDDIKLRGSNFFSGGTIESFADDVEFLSSDISINGTTFTSDDSTIFRAELTPAAGSSIIGATFNATGRAGIREFNVTMTDSALNLIGDLEDVFATDLDSATATLTLLGASSLSADQIQEGVRVVLDGSSTATLTNVDDASSQTTWLTEASTRITLNSPNASLILVNPQSDPSDTHIFNGVTGDSYETDSSTWNPTTWNGTDAVTLSITSTPSDADFNGDGEVDGNDFLIWQRGLGLAGQVDNSAGDANGDGVVNGNDLAAWKGQYGTGVGPLVAFSTIPEPASILLLIVAMGGHCCFRRR